MKKKIVTILCLSSLLLVACGKTTNATTIQTTNDEVITDNETATTEDSVTDSDDVDLVLDTEDGILQSNETEISAVEVEQVEPLSYQTYLEFMMSQREPNTNAIFSSESLNSAFAIYAELLDTSNKEMFKAYLSNKDYLSYKSIDGLSIINRLWVNELKDFTLTRGPLVDKDIIYMMDMSDSAQATEFKNQFVSDSTNGFITETPTVFDKNTFVDAMNIIYFKSKWVGGEKTLCDGLKEFENEDGSTSQVEMFCDFGDYIAKTKTATAYKMDYENGMSFVAILPNEGYTLTDVNIDDFINNNVEYEDADVYAEFPKFEAKSTYMASFDSFNLPLNPPFKEGLTICVTEPPVISQIAKIKFDNEGTEAAAVTEIVKSDSMAMVEPKPHYDFLANRPFIYYIQDYENDDIAFMGVVSNLAD